MYINARQRWAGHVVRMEEGRRRWEESIRKDLKEIGIDTGKYVSLTQDRDYWRALVN